MKRRKQNERASAPPSACVQFCLRVRREDEQYEAGQRTPRRKKARCNQKTPELLVHHTSEVRVRLSGVGFGAEKSSQSSAATIQSSKHPQPAACDVEVATGLFFGSSSQSSSQSSSTIHESIKPISTLRSGFYRSRSLGGLRREKVFVIRPSVCCCRIKKPPFALTLLRWFLIGPTSCPIVVHARF